jgi:hypothetical protein
MTVRVAAFALLALVSCGAAGPAPGADARATSAPSSSAAPAADPSVCQEIVERYRRTLKTATGLCATDAECTRYGGVDPDDVCGGVTDATTGRTLARIASELDDARCPRLGYSCPAMQPRCEAGTCR